MAQRAGWLLALSLLALATGNVWVRANQSTAQDPLARAFERAVPDVQTCLKDAELNPRGLRLSAKQRIELQARLDSANHSYDQLREKRRAEQRAPQQLELDARSRALLEEVRRMVMEHLALHGTR